MIGSSSQYQLKYPKACECLKKDKDTLLSFYHFPAEHWPHLRTTNPIESTFATVRLRTQRTKGCGSRIATLTMVYKLGLEAQKTWRRLNGAEKLTKVIGGIRFEDGIEATGTQQDAPPPRTQHLTISLALHGQGAHDLYGPGAAPAGV